MTIQDAISIADEMKPNPIDADRKIRWLSDLDGMIYNELVITHISPDATWPTPEDHHPWGTTPWPVRRSENMPVPQYPPFKGYGNETDRGTVLLVPEPYSDLYPMYLCSKIDLTLAELDSYANTSTLFNNAYQTYCDYYNRTYMPVRRVRQLRY